MAPSPTKCKDRSDGNSKDHSKNKRATKESNEKYCGRDKTQKRCSASSGSSSTRCCSSSISGLGSSTSTGSSSDSSSSSASSCWENPSKSCSSSSSSSSSSPSPSQCRHNRRHSCSKSKPPKRDEKERKRQSPCPKPTKVYTGRLTRNVTKDHILEIFSTYEKITVIDMPVERMHPSLSKHYAYVEFENPDEAEKALKHMVGGQIDGQITATAAPAPAMGSPGISASQENATTISHVAQVTPTDEEKVPLSQVQVSCMSVNPAPWLLPPPP